jgi:hypothetical protein
MPKNYQDRLLRAFESDSYIKVSKHLLQVVGPKVAIYIANLVDKHRYFREQGMLTEDRAFFLTMESQAEQTGMSKKEIRACMNRARELGVVDMDRRGIPAKYYYKLDGEALHDLVEQAGTSPDEPDGSEGDEQGGADVPKSDLKEAQKSDLSTSDRGTSIKETKYKETKGKDKGPSDPGRSKPTSRRTRWGASKGNQQDQASTIIEYWNGLSGVTHHHSNTKTLERAHKMLNNLLSGKPLLSKTDGTPYKKLQDFADRYGLPHSWLTKQWTRRELRRTLRRAAHSVKAGERPTLEQVLWNNFANGRASKGFSLLIVTAAELDAADGPFYQVAGELIRATGMHSPSQSHYLEWARQLETFAHHRGITTKELHGVITTYARRRNEKFMPVVDDAEEFTEKYDKIVRALGRNTGTGNGDLSKRHNSGTGWYPGRYGNKSSRKPV